MRKKYCGILFLFLFSFCFGSMKKLNNEINFQITKVLPEGDYYDNGEEVLYRITLLNEGKVPIEGTLSLEGVDAKGNIENIFQNNSLTINEKQTNKLENIILEPEVERNFLVKGIIGENIDFPIGLEGNFTDNKGNNIQCKSLTLERIKYNISGTLKVNEDDYIPGDKIEYTISLKNRGLETIKNISLEDILNRDEIFEKTTITGIKNGEGTSLGNYSSEGNLSVTGGILGPLGKITYIIEGTIKNTYRGPIKNEFSYTIRGEKNTIQGKTLNIPQYEYKLNVAPMKSTYSPGKFIEYSLNITNISKTVPLRELEVDLGLDRVRTMDPMNKLIKAFPMEDGSGSIINIPIIKPGQSREIRRFIEVNKNAVGSINIEAKVQEKNLNSKLAPRALYVSKPGKLKNELFITTGDSYYPKDTLGYRIVLTNDGQGILTEGTLVEKLKEMSSTLANSGIGNSSVDIEGNPLESWKISISTSGLNSSYLLKNGGEFENCDLNDKDIVIYPGQNIVYTIFAQTKKTAIGNIILNPIVNGIEMPSQTIKPMEFSKEIVISKYSENTEYGPGDSIEYLIEVKNNSGKSFGNNIPVKDILSKILGENYLGKESSAFKSWILYIKMVDGNGSKPSDFQYGVTSTEDLNLSPDVGPSGSIVYRLVCVVNNDIVGPIKDNVSSGIGDTVEESGTPIKMYPPKLKVIKEVNSTEYVPGQSLTYTINVENYGEGIGSNIGILDDLNNIKGENIFSQEDKAYSKWSIVGNTYSIKGGGANPISNCGLPKEGTDENLDVKGTLFPGDGIQYIIKAEINPLMKGKIINSVHVNNQLISDKGAVSKDAYVTWHGEVSPGTYPIENNQIIYTVVVRNDPNGGFATGVPIKDEVSKIEGELLRDKSRAKVFKSWTVNVETEGIGSKVQGTFENNKDISGTMDIAPGGYIKLTITGTVNNNSSGDHILYGEFTNSVLVKGTEKNFTVRPKKPILRLSKAVDKKYYDSQNPTEVTYEVTVENVGDGYLNNGVLTDNMGNILDEKTGKLAFEDINMIIKSVENSQRGSYVYEPFNENGNLKGTLDIAPHSKIVFQMKGKTKKNVGGLLINKAQVEGDGNYLTASATIDEKKLENRAVYINKYAENPTMTPGENYIYYVDVVNNSKEELKNIQLIDDLNLLKGTLANNGKTLGDISNGNVFIPGTERITRVGGNFIRTRSGDINLQPWEKIKYKVEGIVDPKILPKNITNIARIISKINGSTREIASASVTNDIYGGGPIISEIVKVNGVQQGILGKYTPGDEIEYIYKITGGGKGYTNNYKINNNIENIKSTILDGVTRKNIFGNKWFIEYDSSQIKNSGTIVNVSVSNNSNISGEADIAPGDTLIYKIKGIIGKDISGNIEIGGSTLEPYRCNLNISKTVTDIAYSPGKTIGYILKIKNNSRGNGVNIPIIDDLSSIKVKGINGDMIEAFDKITKLDTKIATEGVISEINSNWQENKIVSGKISIPVGGEIEYLLEAQINSQAVGQITNILQVGTDKTSAGISSARDRLEIVSSVISYEFSDGSPMKIFKYSPGGYVNYKIIFTNKGQGSIDDCSFKDNLMDIKGLSWSGELINVFDSVSITITNEQKENIINKNNSGNIDSILDIKPGGKIIYDIRAKINKNLVGAFNNHFSVNGVRRDFENSVMAPSIIKVKKSIEGNIENYVPGQGITYNITLTNEGYGTDYGKSFQDLIKYINTEISGPSEFQGNPFEKWSVELPKISSNKISNLNGLSIGPNENIDTSKVVVGPLENLTFKVLGTISGKAIGNISNSAIYNGETSTVTVKPEPGELIMSNRIVRLNGEAYKGQKYAPGDKVEYLITIENAGKGFLKNLSINDNFRDISGKKAGNENKSSILKNINIVYSNSNENSTIVGDVTNGVISQRADIAPGDKIIYKVTGEIANDAIGIIGSNLLRVDSKSLNSETIVPKESMLIGSKSILSKSSSGSYYIPGEQITYEMEIDNRGEGYGDNVSIKDLLQDIQSEIVGGRVGNTFSSWKIKRTFVGLGTNGSPTVMKNIFESPLGLDDMGDIAPGSTVKYEISAIVSGDVIGDVQNIGRLNGQPILSKKLTLKPGNPSDISMKKIIVGNMKTYEPGQDLNYLITINNNSDTTFVNLRLEDILSKINTLSAGGNEKSAFQGGWTIDKRITSGIPENSYVDGINSRGDIKGRIDLGRNSTLDILIETKVSPVAMGTITNNGKLYYNNNLIKNVSVSVNSEKGHGVPGVEGNEDYIPGQDYIYTISLKNTGKGFIKSSAIVDKLNQIKVKVVDDNIGMDTTEENAFDINSIKILEAKSTGNNSYLYPYDNGKSSQSADIAPGETLIIKILGKVNPKAVGNIVNNIDFTEENETISNSLEKITSSKGYELVSKKTVIGYDNGNDYSADGQLVYKIDIKNNGQGWAYNIPFKDDISKDLIVEKIDLIGISYKNGFQLSNNVLGNIAINPLGTGTIMIYCKVNPHVIEEITNIALVDNKETNKVISKPISTNFSLAFKSEEPIYTYDLNGDIGEVVYTVTVLNKGEGIGYIELSDDLKNIQANSSKGEKMTAFKSWEFLEITKPSGINEVKNPNNNLEMKGYLEPKETISLKIKCKLNSDEKGVPVSEIDNTLVLDYIKNGVDNFIKKTVTVNSPSPKLEVIKTIKTLGTLPYNNSSKYIPGEDIVYEINVKNLGEGFALGKDTVLEDNLALVSGDILGGGKDALIEGKGISVTNLNNNYSEFIRSRDTSSNNYGGNILLAPKDSMTFEVKGKINPLAVGKIPGNIVIVGKKSSTSESVEPQEGTITSTCTVDKETFYPGDNLTYKITLENTGKGYVKNLSLQDILGDIKTERVGADKKAFKNWTINVKNLSNGKYYLRNSYPNENINLSDSLDIGPGEKLEIEIIGTVASGVYGEIINNISIGGKTTSLKSKALLGKLSLSERTLFSQYVPDGEVVYEITIENKEKGVVPEVNIEDKIGNILSCGENHQENLALDSWTMESIIAGKDLNETTVKIPSGGNINIRNGFIGPETTIKIKINGKVSKGIHGDITNTIKVQEGIGNQPLIEAATVVPTPGRLECTLKAQDKTYIPGENIEYTLKITNEGVGYCNNVEIKDDLSKIDGLNISSLEILNKKIGKTSDIHEDKSDLTKGILDYIGDIAPQESIEIIFSVKTTMEAKNTIENIGEIIYLNNITNPKFEVESVPGDFSIGLTCNEKNYIPSKTVTYIATIENRGKGWLEGISVLENINQIKSEVLGNTQEKIFINPICAHIGTVKNNIKIEKVPEGFKLFGDIPPMTKLEYSITAMVSKDALGPIKNKLIAHENGKEYYSPEVTLIQKIPKLSLNLVEDKKNYYPNEDMTYTLTVENNTDLNIKKVILKDDIGSATVLTGEGKMELAFNPDWTIENEQGKPLNISDSNCDIEFQMNSHSKKVFKISGKVIYNAVGKLLNGARIITDIENISNFVQADPLPPDITIKKIALEKNYTPNKNIHYEIQVKNGLNGGYGDNVKIEDILSEIKATGTKGIENPFQLDRIKIKVLKKDSQVETFWSEHSNQYDLRDTIDIPRGQGITYEIQAFVKNNIIGKIENIAKEDKNYSKVDLYSVASQLKLEVDQVEKNYIPGENINYTIKITNIGEGVAYEDEIFNNLQEITEKNIRGTEEEVLENWTIKGPDGLELNKENLKETLTLLPGDSINFQVQALVNKNAVENIEIPIYLNKGKKDVQLKKVKFISSEGNLKLTKTADKKSYVDSDKDIVYTITAENIGMGNLRDITIKDLIGDLRGKNGNSLFKSWTIEEKEIGDSANFGMNILNNENLNIKCNLRSQGKNKLIFKIKGEINKGLDDDITNKVIGIYNNKEVMAQVTTHVKKIPDNTGNLTLVKRTLTPIIKVGELASYEIIVDNNNESRFLDTKLLDIAPRAFNYIKGSGKIVYYEPQEKDKKLKEISIEPKTIDGNLNFEHIYLEPFQRIKITYTLKASIGVSLGIYENRAYMVLGNRKISNEGKAYVKIIPDSLLNKGTIIGKVYEDLNKNSYQDDPTIKHLNIIVDGKSIKLGKIYGISKYRNYGKNEKIYRFYKNDSDYSKIEITCEDMEKIKELKITKNIYWDSNKKSYLHEIIIENVGYYEDGIPGVKVLSPRGEVAVTDEYGRYHLPQEWIYNSKGENYSVKVDIESLPKNMKVLGENPKVKRITPQGLVKFNFPIIDEGGKYSE